MSLRHLIAEQVLLEGELVPAHLEVGDDGIIRRIHRLEAGSTARRAAIVRAREVSAGAGMHLVRPRMVVLPGAVDTHVSFCEPGHVQREGFSSGTMAAALGGVTSVLEMPHSSTPVTVRAEDLQHKRSAAAEQAYVDIGFWAALVPPSVQSRGRVSGQDRPSCAEPEELWESGAFGFVCTLLPFDHSTDALRSAGTPQLLPLTPAELREAMMRIARFDGLLAVHAEDSRTVAAAAGATGANLSSRLAWAQAAARYSAWAASRPAEAEVIAVEGLIDAVRETGCRTHILQVSTAGALELIAAAKAEGLPLSAETCTHYLSFAAESVPVGSPEFVCWPPLRDVGHREALWQGLQEGILDAVVSAHSPTTRQEKLRGAADLRLARPGISGLQVGFAALASEARSRGIGLAEVSRWTSGGPAELCRLHQKGDIAPGRYADLLIYDPEETHVVSAAGLAHKTPLSAYEGMEIHGTVVGSVLRGMQLFTAQDSSATLGQHGQLLSGPGTGVPLGPGPHQVGSGPRRRHLRAVSA
ncbi:dihydroorotase [Nesterenkonia massiliensis]|uniref:dihydroorotase n=1 Tax=Nesterenkonia massiliensis TaxID=1232429 RepID=UPI00040139F3|nr:amidohydrolase family protein [Nesterenkonia massiliensis]